MKKTWKVKSIAILAAAGILMSSFSAMTAPVYADEMTEEVLVMETDPAGTVTAAGEEPVVIEVQEIGTESADETGIEFETADETGIEIEIAEETGIETEIAEETGIETGITEETGTEDGAEALIEDRDAEPGTDPGAEEAETAEIPQEEQQIREETSEEPAEEETLPAETASSEAEAGNAEINETETAVTEETAAADEPDEWIADDGNKAEREQKDKELPVAEETETTRKAAGASEDTAGETNENTDKTAAAGKSGAEKTGGRTADKTAGRSADEDSDKEADKKSEETVPETHPLYGTATGSTGFGNAERNVRWVEYEADGIITLVFSAIDASYGGESCAVTVLTDQDGTVVRNTLKGRVNRIVFEEGITGAGWTYLYKRGDGEPAWPDSYPVDGSKTDAFNGFSALTTVVPCSTLQRIGWSAFKNCTSLTDFDFTACTGLTEIMNQAFNGCRNLNIVNLSNCCALTTIGWSSFNGAGKGGAWLALPADGSLSVIGGYAFNGFSGTSELVFPATLTKILQHAFDGAGISGDLTGLPGLTTIGAGAFKNTGIRSVEIPAGMTSLAGDAFTGVKTIGTVIWNAESFPNSLNTNQFQASAGYVLQIGANAAALPKNFFQAVKNAGDVYFDSYEGGRMIRMDGNVTVNGAVPFSSIKNRCFVDDRGVVYELANDTATVAYAPAGIENYTVPAVITTPEGETFSVTEIAPFAFSKARDLGTVLFENAAQITKAGESAFKGLGRLSKVVDKKTGKEATTVNAAKALFANVTVPADFFVETGLLAGLGTTVEYHVVTAENDSLSSYELIGSLPKTAGDAIEELYDRWSENYTVQDLQSHYYHRYDGQRRYYTYEFKGWKTENGAILAPGTEIDLNEKTDDGVKVYDPDADGIVTLTAEWSYTWASGSGLPSVFFPIWTTASSANSAIDSNSMLSEKITNYTPYVGAAIMNAFDEDGNIIFSDQLRSPSTGGTEADKFLMITYVNSSILEADAKIRELASETGYTTEDPYNGKLTWHLSNLPSDEEVMRSLAEMVANGRTVLKDEENRVITAEELTTDNFVVRWCYAKYQSGRNDGWHIDGKLTRRVSYTTITKTFYGEQAAIDAAIEKGFHITLTNTEDPEEVITLSMEDRTGAGIADGKITETQYGYIRHTGSTYTWIVFCDERKAFTVREDDYSVTLGDVEYGVHAQYNQINTGNAADAEVRVWEPGVTVTATAHPIDDTDASRFETTNLYNTYIPEGVFVIGKYDDGAAAMANVEFSVFDEEGTQLRMYSAEGSAAGDGQYNVLYENGSSSDTALTGTNGSIYLKLPEFGEARTYTIRETIPAGYRGYEEYDASEFSVTVAADGSFSVDDIHAAYGSILPLTADGSVWGVKVVNESAKADVVIESSWAAGVAAEENVTIVLKKTVNGVTETEKTVVLNEENGWTIRLEDLPLTSGNVPVRYSIEETKIGDLPKTNPAFRYWRPQYQPAVYRKDGEVLQEGDEENAAVFAADEIILAVENDRAANTDVTVVLHKIDRDTEADLSGVEFWVYKALDDQSERAGGAVIEYNGHSVRTGKASAVTTGVNGLAELKFHYSSTYYIREYGTLREYEAAEGWIRVTIDAAGNITVEHESSLNGLVSGEQTGTKAFITVRNAHKVPAPTGFHAESAPFVLMLLLGAATAALALLRRRAK